MAVRGWEGDQGEEEEEGVSSMETFLTGSPRARAVVAPERGSTEGRCAVCCCHSTPRCFGTWSHVSKDTQKGLGGCHYIFGR